MSHIPNLWKLYLFRFFSGLIPAYVIERLFWESRGMTVQMVVYTEILFAVTVVLLEVPTGIAADKWGRKPMIALAAFIGCCEFFILVFATQFWHFAFVIVLTAVGRSASSGAETALLYDSLLSAGEERAFEKHLGRMNALDIAAIMIAALSGSMLASRYGFTFNYWLSFASMLIALVLAFMLIEPAAGGSSEEPDRPIPIRAYIAASVRLFRSDRGLLLVVLSGTVTGAAINFVDEFWQIYLDRLGIPVLYFGLFSAAIFMLRFPGNLLAYKLKERFRIRHLIAVITAVMAAGFAALATMHHFGGLAALFIVCLFAGMLEPLAAGYLHHRVDSSMRATMGSFQSLGENAVLIVTGLGFGYFAARFDVFGGYGFIAAVCAGFFVYYAAASAKTVE